MKKIKILSSLMCLVVVLTVISSFSCGIRALDDSADIATWRGFRKGAVTFTFDKGAPSHVNKVAPLFDKYDYKASFYLVEKYNPDWDKFQDLADNGHEIGSNSKTYPANISGEEESSKLAIEENIKSKYGCITLAYPNGNLPRDFTAVKANYIAARTYNGTWHERPDYMGKDGPTDWTQVPALFTGSEYTFNTSDSFVSEIKKVVNINGWVVFTTEAIKNERNGNATYSPTDLNAIDGTLSWVKENDKDVWLAPLCDVAMYIKERKASQIVKTAESQNSITYSLTHKIADDICKYDYPLSIRCALPTGWNDVYVTQGKNVLDSKIVNGMVWFDAVPNGGDIVVDKAGAIDPTVILSKDSFEYDGTVKTPGVTVKNGDTVFRQGTDYTVTYDSGRIEPGTYNVKVDLTGKFSGTKTVSFTIKPAPKPTAAPTATPTATATPAANPTKTPAKPTAAEPTKASLTLSIDKETASVVCGKTASLKATLKGSNAKITWKSSDTKVATVDSNGKVTAKMAGEVTITATAAGKSASCKVTVLYKDVTNSKDFWYAPTNYLTAKGVVKGYDKQTKFKPANMCTRAQMVTFIWRLMGEPAPKAKTCKFKDVKKTDYFYKACIWGNEKKIVEGYKDGTFGPQIVCARRHAVTFLWRLAGKPAPKTTKNPFKDVKKSDYFYKATLWASEKKILAGYSDGTFKPNGDCLRRQMVTFLYKYDKYINNKG